MRAFHMSSPSGSRNTYILYKYTLIHISCIHTYNLIYFTHSAILTSQYSHYSITYYIHTLTLIHTETYLKLYTHTETYLMLYPLIQTYMYVCIGSVISFYY